MLFLSLTPTLGVKHFPFNVVQSGSPETCQSSSGRLNWWTPGFFGKVLVPVLTPAFDFQVIYLLTGYGFNKPLRQLKVGNQWDAKINSLTAYDIVVGELFLLVILRDIND